MRYNNKNVILPEPWVQPGPANDEIWYTSSDGNIVKPYKANALPTIVSNTYVDGKGIIKFAIDVTSIGYNAFKGSTSLTSVIFGNSLDTIGNYVFENCTGLTSMTIPNSATSIGEGAFINCRNLTSITYTGTITQWNAITKGSYWHNNVPATVVHCTDGDAQI